MKMTQVGPENSEESVRGFESRFNLHLSPLYRAFLKQQNGGVPERRWFRVPEHIEGWDLLDFFYGLGHPDKVMSSEEVCSSLPEYVSMGLVPIAATASAGLLCINSRSGNGEEIVYLDAADHWGDPMKKTRYFVASDVFALLLVLESEPS